MGISNNTYLLLTIPSFYCKYDETGWDVIPVAVDLASVFTNKK